MNYVSSQKCQWGTQKYISPTFPEDIFGIWVEFQEDDAEFDDPH